MLNFSFYADFILNHSLLFINGSPHRILEIEFYYFSLEHPDTFVHCNEMQLTTNQWYFHRAGSSAHSGYRGGTFKGLDITFGNGRDYGGILIRSIQGVEGPCRVVDYILKLCSCGSIEELVSKISLDISAPGLLNLQSTDLPQYNISAGPRVGLSFKKANVEDYIFRPYRFGIQELIKKDLWGFILTNPFQRSSSRYYSDYLYGTQLTNIDAHKEMKTIRDKCICFGFLNK